MKSVMLACAPCHRLGGAIIIGVLALGTVPDATAQLVNLQQLSFNLDGASTPFTGWGGLDITHVPSSSVQYLNVRVGTGPSGWVLQNVPFMTREGVGISQTDSFQFDLGGALGFSTGTNVAGTNVPIGVTITPSPAPDPGLLSNTTILGTTSNYGTGAEESGALLFPTTGAIIGGLIAGLGKSHQNFPNQESLLNQCTPVSVSNSLMFLKAKNPTANWGTLPIDIATMRTATKWKVAPRVFGCYIDDNINGNAWWKDKDAYMRANGYPIMTTRTTSFADIVAAIMNGKDVELQGDWHTAAVVGIVSMGNGNWALQVAHDTDQDNAGGTRIDTILYDATTMKFIGSPGFFDGSKFRYAVIEMVPSPAGLTLLGLAAGLAARRRRR